MAGRGKGGRNEAGQAVESQGLAGLDSRVAMIQALIPVALDRVQDLLQEELEALTGTRYGRAGGVEGYVRWGRQAGSVYLADQKVPTRVPRVRDLRRDAEVPLASYQALRNPRRADEAALARVLRGLSCRDYQACVQAVPETFGLSGSSLSRRFIRASQAKLRELAERDLSDYDLVGLFLDGKTFGDDEMVIALGVTLQGNKVILGFVQTASENEAVCRRFLEDLKGRGLRTEAGLLVVIDGSKGLAKAVKTVLQNRAVVQRCQWHKRENVVRHLPKEQQPRWRRRLQKAYSQPTYAQAKAALTALHKELEQVNLSAARSLAEGLEETLTLHRLGLFGLLGRSFKTTNCIENMNSLVGQRTDKVDRWRNASQKHRWLAAALLEVEPRLRKVAGYQHLSRLRSAVQAALAGQDVKHEAA
jgi:transposase-like protein